MCSPRQLGHLDVMRMPMGSQVLSFQSSQDLAPPHRIFECVRLLNVLTRDGGVIPGDVLRILPHQLKTDMPDTFTLRATHR